MWCKVIKKYLFTSQNQCDYFDLGLIIWRLMEFLKAINFYLIIVCYSMSLYSIKLFFVFVKCSNKCNLRNMQIKVTEKIYFSKWNKDSKSLSNGNFGMVIEKILVKLVLFWFCWNPHRATGLKTKKLCVY